MNKSLGTNLIACLIVVVGLLGENNINIAGMAVGRTGARENAVMAMLLDDPVSDDVITKIKEIECVQNVKSITL